MPKFEVRPPTVEAHQVPEPFGRQMDWVAVEQWCSGDIRLGSGFPAYIELKTLGGITSKAYPGDWIVDSKNGRWIVEDKVFEITYKEVTDG